MEQLIVSNSEIQEFKRCRRSWYLRYVRGLRKPEKATGALALGTNVHECLGTYYSPGGSVVAAMAKLEAIYVDAIGANPFYEDDIRKDYRMAYTMCEGYFDWVEQEGIDSNLIILQSESEIEGRIRLPNLDLEVVVLGKRDLIGADEHERKFFLDFKTCQSLGDSLLDINEQLLTYALLHKLANPEDPVQYAIWRMLRKTLRTERAKPPFYATEQIELSDKVLRNFYLRLTGTLEDMARAKLAVQEGAEHRVVCYPTASSRCSWGCEFRVACPMFDRDDYAEQFVADNYEQHNPYSRYETKGTLDG